MNDIDKYNTQEKQNPYLIMGFWEFAIMSTLMVVFFPWSLLFCVIFYGLEDTKLILKALIHDAIKTFLAILSVAAGIIIIVLILVLLFQ